MSNEIVTAITPVVAIRERRQHHLEKLRESLNCTINDQSMHHLIYFLFPFVVSKDEMESLKAECEAAGWKVQVLGNNIKRVGDNSNLFEHRYRFQLDSGIKL